MSLDGTGTPAHTTSGPTSHAARRPALAGQVIFFTGTLSMEGADAKARAEAAGAHVCSSFTAETTLVVSGPGADKYVLVASAASLMSTIWDEETFVAAVSTTHMPGAPSSSSSSSDAPGPAIGRMLTSKAVPTRISTMRVRAVLVPCLPTAEALTPPHGDADYLFKFAVDLGGVQSVKARLVRAQPPPLPPAPCPPPSYANPHTHGSARRLH